METRDGRYRDIRNVGWWICVFVQSIWSRCIVLIMVELETWKKWVNQGGGYGIINR